MEATENKTILGEAFYTKAKGEYKITFYKVTLNDFTSYDVTISFKEIFLNNVFWTQVKSYITGDRVKALNMYQKFINSYK